MLAARRRSGPAGIQATGKTIHISLNNPSGLLAQAWKACWIGHGKPKAGFPQPTGYACTSCPHPSHTLGLRLENPEKRVSHNPPSDTYHEDNYLKD
jgi:hypothetical protein